MPNAVRNQSHFSKADFEGVQADGPQYRKGLSRVCRPAEGDATDPYREAVSSQAAGR